MKKGLFKLNLLLACCIMVCALAACGKKRSANTVIFWHTMGDKLENILIEVIDGFNEEYPDIKIKQESIGGYTDLRDQIVTKITAGDQPNLAYCYPDHVALYRKANAVLPLDSFINDDEIGFSQAEIDNFVSQFYLEGATFGDNKMYTLPFLKSTELLYYNETFFTQHNLALPTTWDELWALCEQIKQIDPNSIPIGIDSESNLFITLAEQQGNGYTSFDPETKKGKFDFNNDENKAFVTELKENYDKGYFTTEELYGSYTSGLFTNTEPNEDGKVIRSYMVIGSSGGATYQATSAFNVGITMIPQEDVTKPKAISQGPSLCLFDFNKSVNEKAWTFMKYLLRDEVQIKFAIASGYMPVTHSAQQNQYYVEDYLNLADGTAAGISALAAKQAIKQVELDAYFVSPAFVGSSTARDEVGNIIILVMEGQKTVAKAFKEALEECEYNVG